MAFTYRNSAYLLDHWIVYTHQIHAFIDFPEDGDLSGFIPSYVCVFFAMSSKISYERSCVFGTYKK